MSILSKPKLDDRGSSDNTASSMSRRELLKMAGMAGAAIATAGPGGRALASSGPDSLAARRAATAASSSPTFSLAAEGRHPLDPLSGLEIIVAFTVIESDKRFPNGGVYPIIQLHEPPKSEVLSWRAGQQFRREAFANVYDNDANRLFEVVVDLRQRKIISWIAKPGVQPAVHDAEYGEADELSEPIHAGWQQCALAGLIPTMSI